MKWRNQLLALFCLIVFFGFGVFYFRYWVVQKPFGIILFVGEGLDPARLAAARVYAGGADTPLTLDSLPYTALLRNYSKDSATPDEAAAATALATGVKVKNGALGMDAEGKSLENLMELARESGRVTGLVTNGNLTDPTPAGFYAHTVAKENRGEVARVLVESAEIDIVLGGGAADFLPTRKDGRRPDERDLLLEIRGTGYDLVQTLEELEAVPRWRRAKLFGLFSRGELAYPEEEESGSDQPTLSDMVRRSIELLQFHSGGYLLVVDAGLMRKAARAKNDKRALLETVELDRAVSVALRYTGTKSTILVCGDVAISPVGPNETEHGERPIAENSGAVAVTEQSSPAPPPNELALSAPVATQNVPEDVIAFGTGLGADALHGTLENTAIFEIIRDNL